VVAFKETLNCDTVLLPLGLPDENSHSPNENFYLPNFFSGISSSANFMIEMATGY
jgi:acetylornithine deacetylase/succinyl-diaminopimelate desuccinylase-like protein